MLGLVALKLGLVALKLVFVLGLAAALKLALHSFHCVFIAHVGVGFISLPFHCRFIAVSASPVKLTAAP